jgi:threonylcarbamoyladenosine tRNA methylthiotransferase MtaB
LKYALITFGCRVNQADSLVMERELRRRGGTSTSADEADLVVVNTCSVTATADQGARQTIRRIARSNPHARLIVTGCYATRRPEEVGALPNVVQVVPNDQKERLADRISIWPPTTAERFADGDGACGLELAPGAGGRTAFTLRVQTGCEEQCSYCIIPTTRGASRSRPTGVVLEEIRRAVSAGYKEITLTGVHLGSYGRDLSDGSTLTALVQVLAGWPEDVLFRISSLEPMDCTPDIVDLVAASPRLAQHFHLPLQHGSDVVLRAMRRPYSVSHYEGLVRSIRAAMPDASIGSDIIVGFPGESPDLFEEMLSLLRELPLTYLHVFPYSDRPGTHATSLRGKVNGVDVRERSHAVRAIGEQMRRRFHESQVGRTVRGLTVDDGRSMVTGNHLKIGLNEQRQRNEWVRAEIVAAEPLTGRV